MSANLNQSLKKKPITLNRIALYVLLFFGVFDTARLFTPLPSFVGYLKEICIFFLFLQLLLQKIQFNVKSLYNQTFLLLFFISGICLFRGCFFSDYFSTGLLIYQIKNLEFFLLFLIFINLHKIIPSISISEIVKIYILFSIILVAVNLVGVLVPNPICYKFIGRGLDSSMYTGRLSLGQPAMASFPILLSFVYLWMKGLYDKRTFAIAAIFLGYIFLSTAMTAYVITVCVIIIKLLINMKTHKGIKFNLIFVGLVLSFVVLGQLFLLDLFSHEQFDFQFLRARALKIIGIGRYEDSSMMLRTNYKKLILQKIVDQGAYLWGLGPDYYNQIRTNFYAVMPIENSYIDFYAKSGIVGLTSFIVFIVGIFKGLASSLKSESRYVLWGMSITFVLYGWTLPIFATYCMAFGFALFFAYCYLERDLTNV